MTMANALLRARDIREVLLICVRDQERSAATDWHDGQISENQ
jgi:hypothetical protein